MRKKFATVLALVFLLSLFPATLARAAAVSDWHWNPATRHWYGLTDEMPWVDAEALAVRLGGHLVTINDQAEDDWLVAEFPDPYEWIGFTDRVKEGTWLWLSGTRVTFTAWQYSQPDDYKGSDPLGEDAAVLFSDQGAPGWVSISGRWLLRGIVEVPGKPKTFANDAPVESAHDGQANQIAYADECEADGWAWDPDSPLRDVMVRILAMRTDMTQVPMEVWRGPAESFRQDLLDAGMGDGTYGFSVDLRPFLAYGIPYDITVQARDVQTGEWISAFWPGSPRNLTCWPI